MATRRQVNPPEHQPPGRCTWCGHPVHPQGCNGAIRVATGPSGGPGRKVPTAMSPCRCAVPLT